MGVLSNRRGWGYHSGAWGHWARVGLATYTGESVFEGHGVRCYGFPTRDVATLGSRMMPPTPRVGHLGSLTRIVNVR